MLNISFTKDGFYQNNLIVVLVNSQLKLGEIALDLDQKFNQIITHALKDDGSFKGKLMESKVLTVISEGELKRIAIVGVGDETEIKQHQLQELGGKIYSVARDEKIKTAAILVEKSLGQHKIPEVMSSIGGGALLASYKFDKYLTKKEDNSDLRIQHIYVIGDGAEEAGQMFKEKKSEVDGVFFSRDLVSEVPNVLYPGSYAEKVAEELEGLDVDIEVLGEREMRALGMGALLGVGQGSAKESKMVIMRYNGAESETKPICFVGKGVTFDTGGISLKPSAGMDEMKYDMGGSAAVAGAVKALASRGAKANIVGIIGLVENMPGSNAQRPGDVVTTMSGQTVEVLNTDAEGRLVLCDCMTYLQKNFQPECVIDLATLTGAIVVSLANTYGGLFSNDDDLSNKLVSSSLKSNEKLWRMPLHKDYDDMIKSSVADVANIGGRGAGSSTAAHFIQRFVDEGIKWAHLDIAGMAWEKKSTNPICPKGAVGFGVRLLNQFVKDHYE
ncbi:MAG: hypothetical protein DGJ47_000126 [Rickettsiaceae bacterium]